MILTGDASDMLRAVRMAGYVDGVVALLTAGSADVDVNGTTAPSADGAAPPATPPVQLFVEHLLAAGFPARCTSHIVTQFKERRGEGAHVKGSDVALLPKTSPFWREAVHLTSVMLAIKLLTAMVGSSEEVSAAVCGAPGFLPLLLELEDVSYARDVSVAVELLLEALNTYPEAAEQLREL